MLRLFIIVCAKFNITLDAGLQPAHTASRDLYLLQLSFIGQAVECRLADAKRFACIFVGEDCFHVLSPLLIEKQHCKILDQRGSTHKLWEVRPSITSVLQSVSP